MNMFESTIKAYLDKRSKDDELFAVVYAKENKNIEECCEYIVEQVEKSGRRGFADEEIYGMAVHYYDEDNVTVKGISSNVSVVVNHKETEEAVVQVESKPVVEAKKKKSRKQMEEEFKKRQLSLF